MKCQYDKPDAGGMLTDCSSKKLLKVVRCVHSFYLQRQPNYLINITRRWTDRFAPIRRFRCSTRSLSPWLDTDSRAVRWGCRAHERQFHKCERAENTIAWNLALCHQCNFFRTKECRYWTDKIPSADGDSSKLWKSLSSVMQRKDRTNHAATFQLAFFIISLMAIAVDIARASTAQSTFPDIHKSCPLMRPYDVTQRKRCAGLYFSRQLNHVHLIWFPQHYCVR